MSQFVLALDQGTTSSRAILFDQAAAICETDQQPIRQILPVSGHVEHDPEQIWETQLSVARGVLKQAPDRAEQIAALGVTNQRETIVLWDSQTGQPVHNAIVWQSRISASICERLKEQGYQDLFRERTGLLLDPYFSATKLVWLFEQQPELRERARRGELCAGTIDSFLIWRLTGGKRHVTDVSNASRTLMMNLHSLEWDEDLLQILDLPREMLPEIVSSSGELGVADSKWLGREIPITGCAGDQQAATFGQACFQPGMAKNTLGTGGFLLMNVGDQARPSKHRLLSTVGWKIGEQTTYCLEGSVFVAGALIQWLRDQIGLIESAEEISRLAKTVDDSGGVVVVPAFVGLGAPHWDPYARGAIFGLTRATEKGHLARAALESLALQNADLFAAMEQDADCPLSVIRYDGGASVNDLLMQLQSDLTGKTIQRPEVYETTALGAAFLAGLEVGVWENLQQLAQTWTLDQEYVPSMNEDRRASALQQWQRAVHRSLDWERPPNVDS